MADIHKVTNTFSIMVMNIGNGITDSSSNPGQGCLHFILMPLEKGMNLFILPTSYG